MLQEQIEDTASRVDVASVHSQQLEKKIKQFDKVVNFDFGCFSFLSISIEQFYKVVDFIFFIYIVNEITSY